MQTQLADFLDHLQPLLDSPATPLSDSQFNQLARQLFAAQFELVPAYRNLCRARRTTPDSLPDWTHIPPVPTAAFKEFDWTSLPPHERCHAFHSSGTTTTIPSRHFHDAKSLAIYEHALLAWAQQRLFPLSDPRLQLVCLTPNPTAAPHSSLVHMFATFQRHRGVHSSCFTGTCTSSGQWQLDFEQTVSTLRRAQADRQPVALLGTAFLFLDLLDHCAANRIQFAMPQDSLVLETGGYKGRSRTLTKPELYHRLSATLGIPTSAIASEYGMCELSSQAYDHTAGAPEPLSQRAFQFPPWTRTLILDPNTLQPAAPGESGLLRIFDLANVRSVMSIQTDDLARAHPNGFVLLGRIPAAEVRGCSLLSP